MSCSNVDGGPDGLQRGGGGRLGPNYMPGCVCPKVKGMGPFFSFKGAKYFTHNGCKFAASLNRSRNSCRVLYIITYIKMVRMSYDQLQLYTKRLKGEGLRVTFVSDTF